MAGQVSQAASCRAKQRSAAARPKGAKLQRQAAPPDASTGAAHAASTGSTSERGNAGRGRSARLLAAAPNSAALPPARLKGAELQRQAAPTNASTGAAHAAPAGSTSEGGNAGRAGQPGCWLPKQISS